MRIGILGLVAMVCGKLWAQEPSLRTVNAFQLQEQGLAIRRHVEAGKPFTVAGPRGVVLGQQEGTFEAWILPVKLLSHFTIEAQVEGYSVPIDVNASAGAIEVFPDHTTITYSHIAFRMKQIMFAPEMGTGGGGAVVLFQIDAIRPMDITFRFTPEMRPMWPQLASGVPSAEWVKRSDGGFYVLHTDYNNLAGAVAMPGTTSGILAPYQEKPQVHPVELKLHYDPKRDADRYFPLLMAVGNTSETASTASLHAKVLALNADLPSIYVMHAAAYRKLTTELTSIRTPDLGLNDAFTWATVSIEQLRAHVQPEPGAFGEAAPGGGVLLLGGFGSTRIRMVLRQGCAVHALCGAWLRRFCAGPRAVVLSDPAPASRRQDDARVLAKRGVHPLEGPAVYVCRGGCNAAIPDRDAGLREGKWRHAVSTDASRGG